MTNHTGRFALENHIEVPCGQDAANSGVSEIMAIVFGIAIFITNTIVVIAIVKGGKKLQKATFYCIGNLAVADLLAGLLLLWVFGLQKVVLPFRTANSELIQKSVWTITVWSSLLSQIVISIDRYGHVTRCNSRSGMRWTNKRRKQLLLTGIILTWVIPIVTFVLPVATFWNCANTCACYTHTDKRDVIYMWCLPVEECSQVNPAFKKSSMLYLGLVLLLMPFLPIILYFRIYLFVRNSSKKLNAHATTSSVHSQREQLSSKESVSSFKNESCYTEKQNGVEPRDHIYIPNDTTRIKVKKYSVRNNKESDTPAKNLPAKIPQLTSNKSRTSLLSSYQKRSQERDMRLMMTLIIILAIFIVATVPLGAIFVSAYSVTDKRYLSALKIMLTISLFNSLLNPWVYFWRFREMRTAIRKLLCPCKNADKCSTYCSSASSTDRRRSKRSWANKRRASSDSISKAEQYSPTKEKPSSSSSAF